MSLVVPDTGGFVVISQMRPENGQVNDPEEGPSYNPAANLPKSIVKFYSGEPEVLGTTQIFTGILLISLGIPLTICQNKQYGGNISSMVYSGIMLWAGLLYIISGTLLLTASSKPTVAKIRANLVLNIFISLFSLCGMFIAILDILLTGTFTYSRRPYCAHYKGDVQCHGAFALMDIYHGVMVFILMLFTLMFCMAISTSVFACRTLCRSSFNEMTVVIYQTTSLNVTDTTRDVPPDSSAALTS